MNAKQVIGRLRELGDAEDALFLSRYFKTGRGEYGEGDVFLGLRVPVVRRVAKAFMAMELGEVVALLHSRYHEARLTGLVMMVERAKRADRQREAGVKKAEKQRNAEKLLKQVEGAWERERRELYEQYMAHREGVNNWDLVDVSSPTIVGGYVHGRDDEVLREMAGAARLWDRRIAVLATAWHIRAGDYALTLELAQGLLGDREDLMHKATGWMLREVGSRDGTALEGFLDEYGTRMPRTMLRYAIERMEEGKRKEYLRRR